MRTRREIAVSDPLWERLGQLAEELGTDRETLVHQALHALLRFHGALSEDGGWVTSPGIPAREAVARQVLDTARALEQEVTSSRELEAAPGAALWLHGEGGPLARVDKEAFLIGRGRHCDLVLEASKVSREHAVLRREADGWWLEDLGSSNGTWLGGERVQRRRVHHGDEFHLASVLVRCLFTPAPA